MVPTVMGLLTTLIPLAVIVGVVVAIVRARRDDGSPEHHDAGLGTVRRLFLYGVGLLALVLSGVGLSLLLGGALDAVGGETVIADSDTELAVALSFTIVGVPAWLVAAVVAWRSMQAAPEAELASEVRRWYLNIARGIAFVVLVVNGLSVVRFAFGVEDFEGGPWGWLVVWAAIWSVHDWTLRRELATPQTRGIDLIYLLFGTAFGLAILLSGTAGATRAVLSAVYDEAFRSNLVSSDWDEPLRVAGSMAVVGAVAWVSHWLLRLRRRDRQRPAWQIAVFLFGVLPGIALTLVPAAIGLHSVLQWWFGTPTATSAAEHLASLPGTVSVAAVGLATWAYYRSVISDERADTESRSEPERVYRYLVTAAGLLVVAAGIITGLTLAIEVLATSTSSVLKGTDWWRDQLVLTITLLAVGVPVWANFWADVQRVVARTPSERTALTRRAYLFAIFGVASITLLVSLTVTLFNLFDAVLGEGLTSDVLINSRWSLAFAVTAGIAAGYHWVVLREDQPASAEAGEQRRRRPGRDVYLLIPDHASAVIVALSGIEQVRLRVWHRAARAERLEPPTAERIAAVRAELEQGDANCLVLVLDSGDILVEPFTAEAGNMRAL